MTPDSKVSVLVLCRNERNFIEACLDSIVAQDFPPERLEVLVVDGMSADGTREIIDRYARTYPRIRRLDNLHLFIPFAYNAGIKNSSGDPVMIMSAHATYESGYVRRCVEALEKYGADNVVGVWKIQPRVATWKARAIVRAMSDPFGVGNALYRTGLCREPTWVDTGAYGCIRRRVFDDVGLYNEKLLRGEDMEFSYRLRQKGYKTLLVPEAVVHYLARTDFIPFVRHNFLNGAWVIIPFRHTTTLPVAWRHLVPLAFVAGLIGTALAAAIFPRLWPAPAAVLGAYVLAALAASVRIAVRERSVLPALPMPVVFASLHLSYGLGSLWGLMKSVVHRDFWINLRKIVKNR